MSGHSKDIYLVIGGSGFVGRHIVQQLLERGDSVSVFDIVQRYHDTPFYSGDISEQSQVAEALRKSGTTCIIHTASPQHGLNDPALYWKVNVDGTKAVIAAAVETGVRKLVYTSSAGVVFNGTDLIDVDERLPPPEQHMDAYNESKQKGEDAVLEANGKGGLLTVALRPAGIFGPGDRQVMQGIFKVFDDGQTKFQIGDNTNLFDWTYVENVAYAHLLAADKLDTPAPALPLAQTEGYKESTVVPELTTTEHDMLKTPLKHINLTTGDFKIPTSKARLLGPCRDVPPDGEQLVAAFRSSKSADESRPITRSRFDPLSDYGVSLSKLQHPDKSPLQVAGQVFFITNGEPFYFWDMPHIIWHYLDDMFPGKRSPGKPWVLPRTLGLIAATGAEWAGWLRGREPAFTRFKVTFSCVNRWHNIEKARRVLGYEPKVGVAEGAKRMFEWWKADYASQHQH